jgi:hypothetical protein
MSPVGKTLLWITLAAIPGALALGLCLWLVPDEKKGLEKLYYAAATAFAFLGVVGTLTLVWVFLWEGTRAITALKSTAYSQLYARLAELSKALMDGCENRDWSADPPADAQARTQDRRAHLCDMAFSLFEEVYYQRHKFYLLDDADWNGWIRTIHSFLSRRYVRAYWHLTRSHYAEPFVITMSEIVP